MPRWMLPILALLTVLVFVMREQSQAENNRKRQPNGQSSNSCELQRPGTAGPWPEETSRTFSRRSGPTLRSRSWRMARASAYS